MKEQFIRNLGIMSEEDVDKLQKSHIAIAGCGCIGGFSAELLVRMGIGKVSLADPDVFDISNINRQCAATHLTVGQNKVDALSEHLLTIYPELEVRRYREGIQADNVDDFIDGADYVIDAIDYFAFPKSILLHRAARKANKHVITAVALGFGTSVLAFSPNGLSLESYLGIPEETPIEQLDGVMFNPSGYSSQFPAYATEDKIKRWIQDKSIPTISVGQALGPGALVSQLVLHLLGRKEPIYVPESFQLQFET